MPPSKGTAATTRLRKVVCAAGCGTIARQSRSQWRDHGLMRCACGAVMWPSALEDVIACHALGLVSDGQLADHDEYAMYVAETASVMHGQEPHAKHAMGLNSYADPAEIAFGRVLTARAVEAAECRRPACRAPEPIPF